MGKDYPQRNENIKDKKNLKKSIKDINNILFMLEIDGFITKKQGEYKCI